MPRVISAADVLAVSFISTEGPSDYPLAALEAMAAGTPVVGTNIGGITELLDDNRGYLVPPQDNKQLAEALEQAHEMPVRERERVREYIQKKFSAGEVYSGVKQLYQEWT